MDDQKASRLHGYILALLTLFFLLRVLAQAVVAIFPIAPLPSMVEWTTPSASPFSTSGLIPYPLLFSLQVLIFAFQVKVCCDFFAGQGYFLSLRKKTGRILVRLSSMYVFSSALRIHYGGSYYLTHHRRATRKQVETRYPQFVEFLRLKKKCDPEERFQSDWHRHY